VNGVAPAPRWGHTACVTTGGIMLVFGGFGSSIFNDTWALDLSINIFYLPPSLPLPLVINFFKQIR
jgi:hypothetical protein